MQNTPARSETDLQIIWKQMFFPAKHVIMLHCLYADVMCQNLCFLACLKQGGTDKLTGLNL